MANYANLLATIAANIYTNNNNEVTAAMVKSAVDQIVASLGAGYQFMGVAHPSDTPSGYADLRAFWIASEVGTYSDFGGLVVNEGEVDVLKYDGSWSKEVTGAASAEKIEDAEYNGTILAYTLSPKIVPAIKSGTLVKNDSSIDIYLFETTSESDPYTLFQAGERKELTHDVNYFKGRDTGGAYHIIAYSDLTIELDKLADKVEDTEYNGTILAYTLSPRISPTIKSGTLVKNDSSIDIYLFETTSESDPYTTFNAGDVKVLTHDVNYFKGRSTAGAYHIIAYAELTAEIEKQKIQSAIVENTIGNGVASMKANTLGSGQDLILAGYPMMTRKGNKLSFWCNVVSFNNIRICVGYKTYRSAWFEIDNTHISLYHHNSNDPSDPSDLTEQYMHGLTISELLCVNIYCDNDGRASFTMVSGSGHSEHLFSDYGFDANGELKVMCVDASLKNCTITATNSDFKKPLWIIGDSYTGVNSARWPGVLKKYGYFDYLLDGLAGLASIDAFNELGRLLAIGTPKYLIWAIGGNDYNYPQNAIDIFDAVISICDEKGITLIGMTMANVTLRDGEYKTFNDYVRSTGVRYLDLAHATNPDGDAPGSTWYPGMLSVDGVHPTELGAEAIAQKILNDFGEFMNYPLRTDGSIGIDPGDDN